MRKKIKIDLKSKIHPNFVLKSLNKNNQIVITESQIGKNVRIGEGSKVIKSTLGGDVKIGKYTTIMENCRFISLLNSIEVGNFCSIAPNVSINESYHKMNKVTTYSIEKNILNQNYKNDIFSKGKVIIEDDVWIGINVVILSGVKIGRGSVIGAGSVVTKNVEPYSIVAGNPIKFIKKRFRNETIEELEKLKWWLWDIEKILENKKIFQSEVEEC